MATTKRFADNNEKNAMAPEDILPFEQMSDETDKKITFQNLNKQILHNADVECSNNQDSGTITVKLKDETGAEISSSTVAVPLNTIENEIEAITNKIPSQASETNRLADKEFVNSSIATNTAYFKGTFNSLAELEAVTGATNNDYGFVKTTDETGNVVYNRYKYNAESEEWGFEYPLNNSSFTAEQWSAINSGITEGKIAEIDEAISQIGSTVPEPSTTDKLLISEEVEGDLKWVEIDKDKVGEVTTRCTKEEWKNKPLAERIALAGSAVDILDDYDAPENKYKLLWQNNTPTNSFNSQTVEVEGLNDCKMVVIIARSQKAKGNESNFVTCLPKIDGVTMNIVSPTTVFSWRNISFNGNNIIFGNGEITTSYGGVNGATANDYVIPLQIYGL